MTSISTMIARTPTGKLTPPCKHWNCQDAEREAGPGQRVDGLYGAKRSYGTQYSDHPIKLTRVGGDSGAEACHRQLAEPQTNTMQQRPLGSRETGLFSSASISGAVSPFGPTQTSKDVCSTSASVAKRREPINKRLSFGKLEREAIGVMKIRRTGRMHQRPIRCVAVSLLDHRGEANAQSAIALPVRQR